MRKPVKPKILAPLKDHKSFVSLNPKSPEEIETEKDFIFLKEKKNSGVTLQLYYEKLEILEEDKNPNKPIEKMLTEYEPISIFNIDKLKNLSNVKLISYKNCFYYGQILNEMRHGLGIFILKIIKKFFGKVY